MASHGTVNAGRIAFEAAVSDLSEFHRRRTEQLAGLITSRSSLEMCHDVLMDASGIKQVISFADLR